jgi:hypothetical protein
MKAFVYLALASVLAAQDPTPKAQVPKPPVESPAAKAELKPKGKTVNPGERPVHRKQELERREAQADMLSGVARIQKRRASQEQASQNRYKKAENEELKKAGKAKRLTQIAQNQADTHQQRAEAIHQKAERSWKAYLSLNAVPPVNPEVSAVVPKKVEETAKEPAKPEETPKS